MQYGKIFSMLSLSDLNLWLQGYTYCWYGTTFIKAKVNISLLIYILWV